MARSRSRRSSFRRRRSPMSRRRSRRNFRSGSRVHSRNIPRSPMRGGIRL